MKLMRPLAVTAFTLATVQLWACGGAATAASPATQQGGGAPTLKSLSPPSGRTGTVVTVTGTNFRPSANHVHFGIGYVGNLSSSDGTTLRFTVPEIVSPCPPDSPDPCATVLVKVAAGAYQVSIISGGSTSNTTTFTVNE